jgi:hypothetical protein
MMFRDGYEALSVLDDDRDGTLSGAELDGMALWIDANGNGVSEPGEVRSLASAGIARIGVKPSRGPDGVLVCDKGVQFADGRVVKSFDWISESVTEAASSPSGTGRTPAPRRGLR